MLPIEKIFCSDPQGVVSFVGGGGKTSLMFHLANLLVLAGQRVLTTTTTKIVVPAPEQSETVLVDSDPPTVLRLALSSLKSSSHVTAAAAYMDDTGKLKGFKQEDIVLFYESGLFDWILVEADGAAGRPLKAPADHEPVIPSNTTVLVAVAGLDALGQPLSEEVVFRSELAGRLMGLTFGETITESAMARLISSPSGLLKAAPASSRRFIFLNKADDSGRNAAGAMVAEQLRQTGNPVAEAVIIGQSLSRISVNSVHSLELPK